MRNPSIHITESLLSSIINDIRENDPNLFNSPKLASAIMQQAKSTPCLNRCIVVTNDKLKRDSNKVVMAGRSNTSLFCQILLLLRRKANHKGLVLPKVGDKDWLNYKEATQLATEFCNEFQFKLKDGYLKYLEIGSRKMKNFSIWKFKQLHASIIKEYEALRDIELDKFPNQTKKVHNFYKGIIASRIGECQGYEAFPEKYRCFIEVCTEARKYNIAPEIIIKAQFHGFDWRSGLPDPYQLTGLKATERLQVYCFEQGIKLGTNNQEKKINFNKLRDHDKDFNL